jgi:hypothetical protein
MNEKSQAGLLTSSKRPSQPEQIALNISLWTQLACTFLTQAQTIKLSAIDEMRRARRKAQTYCKTHPKCPAYCTGDTSPSPTPTPTPNFIVTNMLTIFMTVAHLMPYISHFHLPTFTFIIVAVPSCHHVHHLQMVAMPSYLHLSHDLVQVWCLNHRYWPHSDYF